MRTLHEQSDASKDRLHGPSECRPALSQHDVQVVGHDGVGQELRTRRTDSGHDHVGDSAPDRGREPSCATLGASGHVEHATGLLLPSGSAHARNTNAWSGQ